MSLWVFFTCFFPSTQKGKANDPYLSSFQIGGKMSSLENHIEFIKNNSLFDGTDFKLAKCDQSLDEKIATECGFTSMSIRFVKVIYLSICPFASKHTISCVQFYCYVRLPNDLWRCPFQELVTFKSNPLVKSPNISSAGKHLSATEFHSVLQSAGKMCMSIF